jgi:hypothetical protein
LHALNTSQKEARRKTDGLQEKQDGRFRPSCAWVAPME